MSSAPRFLTTGGAGFIGSALVRHLVGETDATVINVDKLTYAGNLESLDPVLPSPRHVLEQTDITDAAEIDRIFAEHQPDAVLHLAAESHVDRSIDGAAPFIETNVLGTYTLLDAALRYWRRVSGERRERFRFLHVSTDEVYGSLGSEGLFRESTPYDPRSPYSASKAAADHLARAWHHTYGLPVIITNSSNNYGPYQYPEKLIPTVILRAAMREPVPIYGAGDNVRDWIHVEDHVRALLRVLARGRVGETYNIGADNERTNMEIARAICGILDETLGTDGQPPRESLIESVEDRPGHDFRYAIDAGKIERELEWTPRESFDSGLRQTVSWYLSNSDWCDTVTGGKTRLERQGLAGAEGS